VVELILSALGKVILEADRGREGGRKGLVGVTITDTQTQNIMSQKRSDRTGKMETGKMETGKMGVGREERGLGVLEEEEEEDG